MITKKILVIDDDPTILNLLKAFFERNNMIVVSSRSLEILQTVEFVREFDLILLEAVVGKDCGVIYSEQFKTNPQTRAIPLILMSDDERLAVPALRLEEAFLLKPFALSELQTILQKLLFEE